MIFYLRGHIVHTEAEFNVIEVQGVAYQVFCTNPYAFSAKDEEVTIYIHQHVREDAITLYGFVSLEEQKLFKRLLDVSGIGPRVALGILSGAEPGAVVAAIRQENIPFLIKLPGIGKKTAQRMILDLKDKLSDMEAWGLSDQSRDITETDLTTAENNDIWLEAKEGLRALGYTEPEAERALGIIRSRADEQSLSVDEMMRQALQTLYRP